MFHINILRIVWVIYVHFDTKKAFENRKNEGTHFLNKNNKKFVVFLLETQFKTYKIAYAKRK